MFYDVEIMFNCCDRGESMRWLGAMRLLSRDMEKIITPLIYCNNVITQGSKVPIRLQQLNSLGLIISKYVAQNTIFFSLRISKRLKLTNHILEEKLSCFH